MFCGGSSTFNALRIVPSATTAFVSVPAVTGIPASNFNGSTYQVIGNTVTVILAGAITNGNVITTNAKTDENQEIQSNVAFIPPEFLPLEDIPFIAKVTIRTNTGTIVGVGALPATLHTTGLISWILSGSIEDTYTIQYFFCQISYVLNLLGP